MGRLLFLILFLIIWLYGSALVRLRCGVGAGIFFFLGRFVTVFTPVGKVETLSTSRSTSSGGGGWSGRCGWRGYACE